MPNKKEYKNYHINCYEDALKVLHSLITNITIHMNKYAEYSNELLEFIINYQDKQKTTPIDSKVFYDFDDKIRYRQMMILRMISDEQKESFSYKNVRKTLKKIGYIDKDLPESVGNILNEFLEIRNWSFHNTQSALNATDEVAKMSIPRDLEKLVVVKPQLNPVITLIYDYFDISYLESLCVHTVNRLKQFETILKYMKKDYEHIYEKTNPVGFQVINGTELIDNQKVIYKIMHDKRPKHIMDKNDMIPQISMAMQKKKYDGTKECFDKLTLNKNNK